MNEKPYEDSTFHGLIVERSPTEKLSISKCYQQFYVELYAPPVSEGSLNIEIRSEVAREESLVVDRPFYIAMTHSAIEEVIETPLMVAYVQ